MSLLTDISRADYEGFRYKPIKPHWVPNDHKANLLLKQEFENIGVALDTLATKTGGALSSLVDTVNGILNQPKFIDQLVKINDNDDKAGMLADKLIAGQGITITISDSPATGLMMTISNDMPCIVIAKDFNTHKYIGEAERKIFEFDHRIPNEYYLFDIYTPFQSVDTGASPQYHPDGTERGRYQIRWKSVETKANHFKVNFHGPEFGTVILIGSSSVQRG